MHTFTVLTACSLLFVVLKLSVRSDLSLVLTVLLTVGWWVPPRVGPQEVSAEEWEHFSRFHRCCFRVEGGGQEGEEQISQRGDVCPQSGRLNTSRCLGNKGRCVTHWSHRSPGPPWKGRTQEHSTTELSKLSFID